MIDKINNLKVKLVTPPYCKSTTYMEDDFGNIYCTYRTVYRWGRHVGIYNIYNKHPMRQSPYTKKEVPDIDIYVSGTIRDIRDKFCINGWSYIDKQCTELYRCKFKLCEKYIYDNIDLLIDEPEIIRNQKLPEYILEKAFNNDIVLHKDGLMRSLNYYYISRFQTLSEEFIFKHINKLHLKDLLKSHLSIPAKRKIKMIGKLI